MKITRFNQPAALSKVGTDLLAQLLDRFKDQLALRNIAIPGPQLTEEDYYAAVAALFESQAALPESLVEAVLAVEELASPENKARLEAAFWDSPRELYIQPDASPENTALSIWLNCPYPRTHRLDAFTGEKAAQQVSSGPRPSPAQPSTTKAPVTTISPSAQGENQALVAPKVADAGSTPKLSTNCPPPIPPSAIPSPQSKHSPSYIRRRSGKVACLPKETRDRINEMILDGLTYAAIIKALGDDGKDLNQDSMSNWNLGGYKDWLEEQKDLEENRLREEYTLELVKENVGSALSEATINMATGQIRKALRRIGHQTLEAALDAHPENYVRLLNALARLSSGAISCQSHRIREEQRQANVQRQAADPDSLCVTAETLATIEKLLRLR